MSRKFIKPEMEQHILNSIEQNVRRMKALVEQKNKIIDAHEDSKSFYNICEEIDDYEDAFCILDLDKIIDLPGSYLTYTDI